MRQKLHGLGYLLALAAILALVTTAATVKGQQAAPAGQLLSPGQLDDLVAPIALYPDPLISQVLVATTYPLELIEANQWLQRNPGLGGLELTQAVRNQNWDSSVQGLVAFPDVLNYLTEDIAWTTTLGNAFLDQEADVMDAIQRMRTSAAQSGRLATSPQQQVTRVYDSGQAVYEIVPTEPDILYVPVYDPYYIWGPAAYYPYADWYYPVHSSTIYFNRRVSLGQVYGSGWRDYGWVGWNDWGWRPAWGAHSVFVNNTFIAHQKFTPNSQVRSGTTQWRHDVAHRQGVPYSTPALTQRFRSNDQQVNSRPREFPAQQRGGNPVVNQTSPMVRRDGMQPSGGGGVSNGFRGAGQNPSNPNPVSAVPARTAISTTGQQPSRSFETGRRGNVSQSPVAVAPAVTGISTPGQQPSRSFETGRRGNVSQSPVAVAPAVTGISTTGQQPSRSFETGRRGNVSQSPVAVAPAVTGISTPGQQPSRSFETGRRGNVSQSPVAVAPAVTGISTPGQQPSRSFETGRRGNVSQSPVAVAPASTGISTPGQQPSRSFETGRRGNVSQSPVAVAPAGQSAPARVNVPQQTNVRQSAPTQESSPVSRSQGSSSTQNYGGGGGGAGGRGRR